MSYEWSTLWRIAAHKLRMHPAPPPPAPVRAETAFTEEFPSETPASTTVEPKADTPRKPWRWWGLRQLVRLRRLYRRAKHRLSIPIILLGKGLKGTANWVASQARRVTRSTHSKRLIITSVVALVIMSFLAWVGRGLRAIGTLPGFDYRLVVGLVSGVAALGLFWLLYQLSKRRARSGGSGSSSGTGSTSWGPFWRGVGRLAEKAAVIAMVAFAVYFSWGVLVQIYRNSGLAGLGRVQAEAMPIATRPSTTRVAPLPWEAVRDIIADCESGLRDVNGRPIPGSARQFDKATGEVLIGINTDLSVDRGKWQINSVHDKEIAEREINIMTEAGNEEFARILYERNYLKDWSSSQECWGPQVQALRGGEVGVGSFIVTTTKGWSQVYRFPAGKTVEIRAVETGSGFELMPEGHGRSYTFTAERSDVVPGNIIATSIRSHGDVPAKVQFRIF